MSDITLTGEFPIIQLGYGLIEVANGHQDNVPALIFGRNGMGEIGAPTQPEREHLPGETLAVVTFANVASLDVVLERLTALRAKLAEHEERKPEWFEQLIIDHRIAITPENEGGFHAEIYGEEDTPTAKGYGKTPHDAINAAMASNPPSPK